MAITWVRCQSLAPLAYGEGSDERSTWSYLK